MIKKKKNTKKKKKGRSGKKIIRDEGLGVLGVSSNFSKKKKQKKIFQKV
jgi:hypothetical protein